MGHGIPLVRAMSLLPAVRWLAVNKFDGAHLFRLAKLESAPLGDPLRPVPLLSVGKLLRLIAEEAGPDVPSRIVWDTSVLELVLLGRVAVGTQTPAEALERISMALPLFCSHENLWLERGGKRIVVRHAYDARFDPTTAHLMIQYAAAMGDRLCAMTGIEASRLIEIRIPEHPLFGVEHLRPWFDCAITPISTQALTLIVNMDVANRRFPTVGRDRLESLKSMRIEPLRGDGTLAGSAKTMLGSMLEDSVPTVQDLAAAAGTSVRTLQRRLENEGTSFSALLDEVRQEAAMQRLPTGQLTVGAVAAELGYARQASLTRAVRRWAGRTPSSLQDA